jgi:hypothetical protein
MQGGKRIICFRVLCSVKCYINGRETCGGAVNRSKLIFRIIVLICSAMSASAKESSKSAFNYQQAVKQVQSGGLNVDFKALRLGCVAGRHSCEADAEIKKKIRILLKENKFEGAAREANKALKKAFVDVDLHFFSFIAHTELKNVEKAKFHKAVHAGLLNSIQEGNRGLYKKDALIVISVSEEEAFLKYQRMEVWQKRVLSEDGHYYDEIKYTEMDSQDIRTLYFNLDIPFRGILDLLKWK